MEYRSRPAVTPAPQLPHRIAAHQQEWGFWDGINHVDPDPVGDPPVATPPNPPAATNPDPNSQTAYETMVKERDARKEAERRMKALEQQLRAFEGIDPDTARKAQEIAAKQQEWEEAQAKLKADIEAENKQKYEPQIQQYQQQLAEAQQQLVDYQRDTQLERAFVEAGGFPDGFEYAKIDLQQRVRLSKDGTLEVLNAKGEPDWVADKGQSRPKTVQELIDELKQGSQRFARQFKANDRPGFGLSGNGLNPSDPSFKGMSAWDKVAAMREKQYGR